MFNIFFILNVFIFNANFLDREYVGKSIAFVVRDYTQKSNVCVGWRKTNVCVGWLGDCVTKMHKTSKKQSGIEN